MIFARHLTLISLFLLLLFGCGTLPKPFHRSTVPSNTLTHAKGDEGVRVSLPLGTAKPMRRQIANAVVHALVARNIPANLGLSGKLRYLLSGRVKPGGNTTALEPTQIHWQLSENDGAWFYNFNQDFDGETWEGGLGSSNVIDKMGKDAADIIAKILVPEDKTLTPIAPKTQTVWLKPVMGAPGDGIKSLARAMRYALIRAKVMVNKEPSHAQYFLEGQVTHSSLENELQIVEIRWAVTNPDGTPVGHVVQRNTVPAGTFDHRWGKTAILIATAAVPGIKNLLDRAKEAVSVGASYTGLQLKTKVLSSTGWPVLPPPELSPEPDLPVSAARQR